MAITVNFYSYSKKENSTSRPSGAGASYSCNLKETCSIEAPVIEINAKPASWYNYAYISDFDRYYFVSNWSYFRGIWSAELKVDVLATYKTTIGASSLYILRSSYVYDKEIKDNMYPLKSETNKMVETGTLYNWATGFSGGTYVVYINSGRTDDANTYGSLGYMYFTPTQFSQLLSALYPTSNDSWNTTFFTQAYNVIAGAILNPIDYVTRCVWIPVTLSAGNLDTSFGGYTAAYGNNIIVKHGNLTSYRRTQTVNITVPKRPDVIRGAWANTEPFGKYYLYYAPFGIIGLDSQMLMGAASIDVVSTLDLTTGDLKISIYTVGDYGSVKDRIWSGTSCVGVEVPIDKAKTVLQSNVETAVAAGSIAVDAFVGNYPGAMNDLSVAIGSMGTAPPKSGGSTRGLLALEDTIYLYYEYYDFVDEDNTNKGRPLFDTKQISTIPGYIVGEAGPMSITGTEQELQQIKQHIERGFYYE